MHLFFLNSGQNDFWDNMEKNSSNSAHQKNFSDNLYILTFDLEEWFHILDVDSLKTSESWDSFEVRIYHNTHRILEVLQENKSKATFFVLGWIAKKYPELVRLISDRGYEIGTHSLNHLLVYETKPEMFREDLRKSVDIIQNIIQKKIICFRAPGFSIKNSSLWAFDILSEEGIEIDSSLFPAARGHGGIKDFGFDHPFLIKTEGTTLKEFPINIFRLGGFKFPFSGGGYFRIIPFAATLYFCDRSDYVMAYFHPRDFDPSQPVLDELTLIRKFKSYLGLKKSFDRFNAMIKRYDFVDIGSAVKMIDWDNVPTVEV